MKRIYILTLALAPLIWSCDDDKVRFDQDKDAPKAINLRIQTDATSYDPFDAAGEITFTYFSEQTNIDFVEIEVQVVQLALGVEGERVAAGTIAGTEVTNTGSTQRSFGLTELAALVPEVSGVDELNGGDSFRFYHIAHLTDGTVFPSLILEDTEYERINTSDAIVAASSTTAFSPLLEFPLVCPLDEGFATGTYRLDVLSGAHGCLSAGYSENVTLTAVSNTAREFGFTYCVNFVLSNLRFELACNVNLLFKQGIGLACANGINWIMDTSDLGTFDIQDDSQFTLNFIDDVDNDCGLTESFSFQFTKL